MVDFYEANLPGPLTDLGFVFELVTIPPPPSLGALDLNELELIVDELPLAEMIPGILDESDLSFLDFIGDLGLLVSEPLTAAPPALSIPGIFDFPGSSLDNLLTALDGGLLPLTFLTDQLSALDPTLDPIELAINNLYALAGLPPLTALTGLAGSVWATVLAPLTAFRDMARTLLRASWISW